MKNTIDVKKLRARVFVTPCEGRVAYFLAGLSHYFRLEILIPYSDLNHKRLFQEYFAQDTTITPINTIEEIFSIDNEFDIFMFDGDMLLRFFDKNKERYKLDVFLQKMRRHVQKIYYIEPGEVFFFNFCDDVFWSLIDGVIKHQVFKIEHAHLLREDTDKFLYHDPKIGSDIERMDSNRVFEVEKYYAKIFPLPFPPSITEDITVNFLKNVTLYDIAGNFQKNASARIAMLDIVSQTDNKFFLDYGDTSTTNRKHILNMFNPYFIPNKIGKALFSIRYRRFLYPQAKYVHSLLHTKAYLGLGLFFSSYRTADVWRYKKALLAWNHEIIDYGLPMIDGENYISIGNREQMFTHNINWKDDTAKREFLNRLESILSDSNLLQKVSAGGINTFNEYFSHPKEFVKKLFPKIIFFE